MTIQGTKPQQQHLALHVHNNSTASSLLTLHIIHNSTRIDAHFLQLHSIWTGVRSNRGKRRLFYCWCPSCHQPQHSLSLPLVIPVITPTFLLLLSLQRLQQQSRQYVFCIKLTSTSSTWACFLRKEFAVPVLSPWHPYCTFIHCTILTTTCLPAYELNSQSRLI